MPKITLMEAQASGAVALAIHCAGAPVSADGETSTGAALRAAFVGTTSDEGNFISQETRVWFLS